MFECCPPLEVQSRKSSVDEITVRIRRRGEGVLLPQQLMSPKASDIHLKMKSDLSLECLRAEAWAGLVKGRDELNGTPISSFPYCWLSPSERQPISRLEVLALHDRISLRSVSDDQWNKSTLKYCRFQVQSIFLKSTPYLSSGGTFDASSKISVAGLCPMELSVLIPRQHQDQGSQRQRGNAAPPYYYLKDILD